MKLKQIHKTVFTLCGITFIVDGILFLVTGVLLQQENEQPNTIESQSREYGTQYWLGLPLICYAIAIMVMANAGEKGKLILFTFLVTIPMFILTFTGSILHGTAFTHFMAMERRQSYLSDHSHVCEDTITNTDTNLCTCKETVASRGQNDVTFPVLCSEQSKLVTLHGVMFCFGVIALGLLIGVLFNSMVFILQLQLPVHATSAENQGFSNQGENHYPNTPSPSPELNNVVSHTESPTSQDLPPSYDSLITSFVVTTGVTSNGQNPPRHTNLDISLPITRLDPRRLSQLNHHATVHYRGELNSDIDPLPQTREEQTTLHEITNVNESTPQTEPSVNTEGVMTEVSSVNRLPSNVQLEDNYHSEYDDSVDVAPTVHDNETNPNVTALTVNYSNVNNPNLDATLSESDPRQEIMPDIMPEMITEL